MMAWHPLFPHFHLVFPSLSRCSCATLSCTYPADLSIVICSWFTSDVLEVEHLDIKYSCSMSTPAFHNHPFHTHAIPHHETKSPSFFQSHDQNAANLPSWDSIFATMRHTQAASAGTTANTAHCMYFVALESETRIQLVSLSLLYNIGIS